MVEMTEVIRGVPNWIVVGPHSLGAELLNLDNHELIRCIHNLAINVWRTEDLPQRWKYTTSKVL